MDRVAVIRNGQIANVVLADLETWTPPAGATAMLESEALALYPRASNAPQRKEWANSSEFLAEFTMAQIAAISLSTNPTIAALRLFLAAWVGAIWADDPRVIAGLDACLSESILSQDQRNAIVSL